LKCIWQRRRTFVIMFVLPRDGASNQLFSSIQLLPPKHIRAAEAVWDICETWRWKTIYAI